MITEDYVSFEIAKLLQEKGFDELTYACFSSDSKETYYGYRAVGNDISRPTLQMAMKWLRDKHIVICIVPLGFYCGEIVSAWGYNIWEDDNLEVDDESTPKFITYEEACEAAIKYCCENLI